MERKATRWTISTNAGESQSYKQHFHSYSWAKSVRWLTKSHALVYELKCCDAGMHVCGWLMYVLCFFARAKICATPQFHTTQSRLSIAVLLLSILAILPLLSRISIWILETFRLILQKPLYKQKKLKWSQVNQSTTNLFHFIFVINKK